MGIPQALRTETIPEDTGLPYKFTQFQLNRQGRASSARSTRAARGRSALGGGQSPGQVEGSGAPNAARDLMQGREIGPSGALDASSNEGASLTAAISGRNLSSEMESRIAGDIFGPAASASGLSGLSTGAMVHNLGGNVAQMAQYGGKAMLATAASPAGLAGTMGRGALATGRAHLGEVAANRARSELAAYDPEFSGARVNRMAQLKALGTYDEASTWDAAKGLWSAISFGGQKNRATSQAIFDAQRERTRQALDPDAAREWNRKRLGGQLDAPSDLGPSNLDVMGEIDPDAFEEGLDLDDGRGAQDSGWGGHDAGRAEGGWSI